VRRALAGSILPVSPTRKIRGQPRPREYYRKDDKEISEHAWRARGKPDGWTRVYRAPSHKYVWIEAPRRERKALLALFTPLAYPKAKRSGAR
jgi:hypothetical protein